jgi:hypothetical protein
VLKRLAGADHPQQQQVTLVQHGRVFMQLSCDTEVSKPQRTQSEDICGYGAYEA